MTGVQLGLNVPYRFANPQMSGGDILKHCPQIGLSAVELGTQPVEAFLGLSADLLHAKNQDTDGKAPSNAEQLRRWRKSVSLGGVAEFRLVPTVELRPIGRTPRAGLQPEFETWSFFRFGVWSLEFSVASVQIIP